jgi:hypothetical protein
MHIAILEDEPLLATHAQEVLTRAQLLIHQPN